MSTANYKGIQMYGAGDKCHQRGCEKLHSESDDPEYWWVKLSCILCPEHAPNLEEG